MILINVEAEQWARTQSQRWNKYYFLRIKVQNLDFNKIVPITFSEQSNAVLGNVPFFIDCFISRQWIKPRRPV